MTLTYWTSRVEPKKCLRDPYRCDLSQYDSQIEGDLSIENVQVENWKDAYDASSDTDKLEMRLAFIQTILENESVAPQYSLGSTANQEPSNSESSQAYEIFDVLKLTYKWNKDQIGEKAGWTCDDGFVQDPNGKSPRIDAYDGTSTDSFTMDVGQDCVVDQDRSSVTVDANGFAKFTVHFIRSLKTRGSLNDAVLTVGKPIQIDYMYKLTNPSTSDTKLRDQIVTLNILNGALAKGASIISAIALAASLISL